MLCASCHRPERRPHAYNHRCMALGGGCSTTPEGTFSTPAAHARLALGEIQSLALFSGCLQSESLERGLTSSERCRCMKLGLYQLAC